jgi:hypothetical protein
MIDHLDVLVHFIFIFNSLLKLLHQPILALAGSSLEEQVCQSCLQGCRLELLIGLGTGGYQTYALLISLNEVDLIFLLFFLIRRFRA